MFKQKSGLGLKIFKKVFLLLAVWVVLHTAFIVYDGTRTPARQADVAVILGNKVNEDGTLSPRLEKRLEAGLALYQNKLVDKIMVSGGLGKEGFYEADKMSDYLLSMGVPAEDILVDNLGNNTEATAQNSWSASRATPFKSVIVVSQYFHITRTKMLFRKMGFTEVQGASPHFREWRDLYSIPREFVAYYVDLLS